MINLYAYKKSFFSKYPVVLFMLFWIFLVRCSSRSTVIFIIVSKKNPKIRSEKILLFFTKEIFSNLLFKFIAEKKIAKKIYNFFSVHQNCKTKKFGISKIPNKKSRKIHYFANIKYKRNSGKYCEKNLRRNIFVKKISAKKKVVEKNFGKKIFSKKKNRKKFLN